MSAVARAATAAWRVAAARSARRFARAVAEPQAAQWALLEDAAGRIAPTARGTALAIDAHQHADPDRWRADVPIATFEEHRPWIERVAAGEADVLAPGRPRCMEPTGGTSGVEKLVPITGELLAEFGRATTPWVHDLLRADPSLRRGRAYWSVSPPTRVPGSVTSGGIPIGLEHDSDYFPRALARIIDATLGMPRALSLVRDLDASRHVTLLALLAMDDLAMISVWSPTFLTLLLDALDERWEPLLADLAHGRIDPSVDVGSDDLRAELERAIGAQPARARSLRSSIGARAPREDIAAIWPGLALVSCWTDAQSAHALPAMRERVPGVRIQPKGLLATEGVTSIPWRDDTLSAPVAAVASHLLEFLPEGTDPTDGASARWVHELEPGMRAEVLLTTAGGLTRYRTFDLVEVVELVPGTHTPTLRFLGRADHASDLVGEKLTPELVSLALERAAVHLGASPTFALLTPDTAARPNSYVLVLDSTDPIDADALAAHLECELAAQHHYALARELGQLAPIRAVRIAHPARAWERAAAQLGQRAGSRKDTALDPRLDLLPLLLTFAG